MIDVYHSRSASALIVVVLSGAPSTSSPACSPALIFSSVKQNHTATCPSFAMEQIHLGRMEVVMARVLAAAGFPVLRYHGQGYGDSQAEGAASEIGLQCDHAT